jgi:hypothetical protein
VFSAEVLKLFAELEAVPSRRRNGAAFKDRAHQLARQLGLTAEWWTGNSVTDTSARSIHPEEYVAYANWHRCRAVRKELLRATAGADQLMRIN